MWITCGRDAPVWPGPKRLRRVPAGVAREAAGYPDTGNYPGSRQVLIFNIPAGKNLPDWSSTGSEQIINQLGLYMKLRLLILTGAFLALPACATHKPLDGEPIEVKMTSETGKTKSGELDKEHSRALIQKTSRNRRRSMN